MYEWVKALHVISVISWMAGLLYLPRLFVYHCECECGSVQSETFKVMERRLLRVIMRPAMIASWAFGLGLVWISGVELVSDSFWFDLKLGCVGLLTVVHFYFAGLVRVFAADENRRNGRFFKLLNEVPTVLMIAIVILVIVKPF